MVRIRSVYLNMQPDRPLFRIILSSVLCLLSCSFLSAQTVVEEISFSSNFEADSSDCETLTSKISRAKEAQDKLISTMHRKADSLSKLEYPCYEYRIKIVDQVPFRQEPSVTVVCSGNTGYLAYQTYRKFTLRIVRDRRFNLFYPMHSGKVFCRSDIYRP